jgi:phosphoribosyl 1,2-cyclic phosphate phosphodiesterase
MDRIRQGFGYCLETPPGSNYPPIVEAKVIERIDAPLRVSGAGGTISQLPSARYQQHGDIHSLGFRIGDVAYCSDISDFPPDTVEKLEALDVLIIDACSIRYHPSHLSLEQSLDWIDRLKPKKAILTHMHTPLDYDTVMAETPEHVVPAYDQMSFDVEVTELESA